MVKRGSENRFLIIGLILILSLFAFSCYAEAQTWPGAGSWTYLGFDDNENGTNDDFRDVQNVYYYVDSSYLYLRLCCRDIPTFTKTSPTRDARYKWFIDLDNNSYITGNQAVEAEYLLFSEDFDDIPGDIPLGEVYLLNDTNGDGNFSEWESSPNYSSGGLVTNPAIAAYRIQSACFDQYIAWSTIDNPSNVWLIWATDQENPNLDQSPSTDNPDAGVRIGPITHSYCTDNDGDTYAVEGGACGPVDCNDADSTINPGATEICDNKTNDCKAGTPDGSGESWYGTVCDGPDTDLCKEGTYVCTGGAQSCSDNTGSTVDLCNGADDDCDPASADGSEDPQNGAPCDGLDSDLCQEGTKSCTGGSLVCSDNTGSTVDLCNGADDDCAPASADGSEDPQNGAPCDGPDTDLCQEGTKSCTGGSLVCSDTTGNNMEICDNTDNDCNPATADGSGESWYGGACDGADTDLCNEGTYSCTSGTQSCSDNTGSTVDLCDGLNNDCNPATADGSGAAWYGTTCDGPDTDLCKEGTDGCTGG